MSMSQYPNVVPTGIGVVLVSLNRNFAGTSVRTSDMYIVMTGDGLEIVGLALTSFFTYFPNGPLAGVSRRFNFLLASRSYNFFCFHLLFTA